MLVGEAATVSFVVRGTCADGSGPCRPPRNFQIARAPTASKTKTPARMMVGRRDFAFAFRCLGTKHFGRDGGRVQLSIVSAVLFDSLQGLKIIPPAAKQMKIVDEQLRSIRRRELDRKQINIAEPHFGKTLKWQGDLRPFRRYPHYFCAA